MSSYMIMSDQQMKYAQWGLMVVLVMLGIGIGCSEGCLEEERLALFQLKPFFPFLDSTKTILHTSPARNFFPFLAFYDSEVQVLEEKESSADCCEWERIECNPTTGRVTHLFLNQSDTVVYEEYGWVYKYYYYSTEWERESWYLNASLFLPFEELQTLSLRGNSIAGCVDNQGFESLSFKLDQLEILDLSNNIFNDSILTSLSELSSLKSLNLAYNAFTGSNSSKGIKMLSKLNNLETLDLSDHDYFGNDILSQLHDGFTSLKSLLLQNCGLKETVGLLEFNNLTNLKELHLGINQIESLGSLFHDKGRLRLNKLEVLGLSENLLDNSIFSSIGVLSNLKSLYLGFNKLKGSIHVKDLNALSYLEVLSLSDNEVTDFVLSQELRMTNLEVLRLSGNHFNSSILLSLASLSNLKVLFLGGSELKGPIDIQGLSNLKELHMDCYYSDGGCSLSLQSLGLFPSLKILTLHGFNFSETTMTSHQKSKLNGLSNLEELYVDCYYSGGGCSLSLQSLGLFPSLKILTLHGFNFSETTMTSHQKSKLNGLSNLEELYMDCYYSGGGCSLSLQSLGLFPSLKILTLHGFNFSETTMTSHQKSKLNGLSNLEELYMDCYYSGGGCSLSLQSLGLFPSLKILTLHGFNFSETTMTSHQKSKLNGLSNLEELYMDCYYSGGGCSLSLQSLGLFPSLKILQLYGFNFSETTMTSHQKSKLNGLSNLEELYMYCYYSGDSCSLSLQSLGLFPSLKILALNGFNFSETTMTSHQKNNALPLKNLEVLDVYSTSLGSNFLQKIGAGPSIKFLSLEDCELNGTLHTQGFCGLTNLRELVLANNNLKGNLSECFSNSTFLETLDLSSNQLRIPSSLEPFFNLSKLKSFNADNNTIYVESEMQSLVPRFQLNVIRLSCCGDAGQFPQFLYHQRDLLYVDLSNVNLRGDFPDWLLQNNTNLRYLFLANNSLLGPFELSFTPHTDLSYLDISKNDLYGKVPIEIGAKLPSLYHLNMSKNHFYGSIPASIGDLNSLKDLDLSDNILSGGLPEHLAMGCFSLYSLALSNNMLQGPMFSSAFNLTNLVHLHLDGNHFSGKIPDSLSNSSHLLTLDVSNNNLSGEIPRWMENMSVLSTLDLSKNEFSGEIPRWIGKMSTLEEIVMSNNHLEGPFPVEFCNLNLNLKLLDLSVNNISGSIPSCFSPLWISQVHLSRNKLEGPLTNVFRNSTILVTLDLSNNHLTGKIPNWIGNLSQLSYLLLNNNHFEGGIPVQLCNLGHLSLIDLSNNNLSGTIPPCLKITTLNEISQDYVRYVAAVAQAPSSFSIDEPIQFTAKNNSYSYKGRVLTFLSGIDLSCNKLTGEIPHDVKNFRNIFALNLSHNSLTGPIPLAFSELKQIESLDLSHNNLSGKIPPQLVGLYSLSYFRVGYNNLSGSTPLWVSQFATFDESSYVGNPFLCGKPLPKNCSTSGPSPSSPPKATTDDGLIDTTAFYPSFVVSYIMVILTIASVLYINPYWRRAWFYHIGAINTCCYYFLEDHILPTRFHCGKM